MCIIYMILVQVFQMHVWTINLLLFYDFYSPLDQYPSELIFVTQYSMVWNWQVLRALFILA